MTTTRREETTGGGGKALPAVEEHDEMLLQKQVKTLREAATIAILSMSPPPIGTSMEETQF